MDRRYRSRKRNTYKHTHTLEGVFSISTAAFNVQYVKEGKKTKRAKEYMDIKLTSLKSNKRRRRSYQWDSFSVEMLPRTIVFLS
jgi:hypothetical protein